MRSFKLSIDMDKCKGWHRCDLSRTPDELSLAKEVIIAAVLRRAFSKEFEALITNKPVPINSRLCRLSPTLPFVLEDD